MDFEGAWPLRAMRPVEATPLKASVGCNPGIETAKTLLASFFGGDK